MVYNFAMKRPLARTLAHALAALAVALVFGSVQAQGDNRPVRIVVPFAPGGAQDVIGRYLAEKLGTRIGATVLIDN